MNKKNSKLGKEWNKEVENWIQVCYGNAIPVINKEKVIFIYKHGRAYGTTYFILFTRTMRQLVEINKKFNHSNQKDFKKLESIVGSAFNKYNWIDQMRDIQAQIYVDIMFKHPFLDGNKRTALYWIYKLTHDDYDKFDEYTFKGIIEALGDK